MYQRVCVCVYNERVYMCVDGTAGKGEESQAKQSRVESCDHVDKKQWRKKIKRERDLICSDSLSCLHDLIRALKFIVVFVVVVVAVVASKVTML